MKALTKFQDVRAVLFVSGAAIVLPFAMLAFSNQALHGNSANDLIDQTLSRWAWQWPMMARAKAWGNASFPCPAQWQKLQAEMIRGGATENEAKGVLRVAQKHINGWPLLIKSGMIQNQRVWIVEGAAIAKPPPCGASAEHWNPERLRADIVIVEAEAPYRELGHGGLFPYETV